MEREPSSNKPAPKRVLFLVTEDWYFCLHRLALAKVVRDQGYEVIVATRVNDQGSRITDAGLKLVPIQLSRSSRNPFRDLAAVLELARIYRREKPDIVHHVAMKPILYGSWAAMLSRPKVVINAFAGLGYVFTATTWQARLARGIISLMLRSAFLVTPAVAMFENGDDFEALRSRSVVSRDRSIIVRGSGVDENDFVPGPEAPGDPVVLLAGRMLWDKGIGEFIAAARIVRNLGIKARFALAGRTDPSNPSSISEDQLREWQAEGIVEYWGTRSDMPAVVASAHIVTLPSYREGLPTFLLEAASGARPVVATDVPGCREIVRDGKNGLLVPAKDADALAKALVKLLESPDLRRQMGNYGRQMVLDSFTVRHVTSRVLRLYSELLRGTWKAEKI